MAGIRVLVVDDSVVIRRVLTEALSTDPELEVVGRAANGRIALAKIEQVNPDVVTLDVEMPVMDGLEALAEIRKSRPRLPVIMFSTLTERGAVATLDALSLGANDYVTKPSNLRGLSEANEHIREQLIPKIKAFCAAPRITKVAVTPRPVPLKIPTGLTGSAVRRSIEVVAIGVSTGGPNALGKVLPAFPVDFPVPIVIVQHMPPVFTKLLAERLNSKSAIEVCEASPGGKLEPGRAWVAPGDFHLVVERNGASVLTGTNKNPQENSCRPAVDVLFRSVADVYGTGVLAVVLTGMGQDGLRGAKSIHSAGGRIFVQDESSSVVWGMPGFVARAGIAEKNLPLDAIATAVIRKVEESRSSTKRTNTLPKVENRLKRTT